MKKLLLILLPLGFFFGACEELPIEINPVMGPVEPVDTVDVSDQPRQVLIEEFTGVRCVACPAGSVELEGLLAIHGDQLVAVSIHAGEFAPPHPDSDWDFRITEGENIINYLGNPIGYPSAVVNRKLFDGEFDLQLGKSLWAGYIEQEKAIPPKVRIGIQTDYNDSTRELEAAVTLFVDELIEDEAVHVSVMVTESGMVDRQTTPDGEDYDYVHKHALRDMMTNWEGDPLTTPLLPNEEIERFYTITMDEAWVPANCTVIAFVHIAGEDKDVLQAHEVDVAD